MSQDYIYVLAPDKRPLMPTRRYGHVLKLLQRGKARIAEHVPLTIQLKYNTPGITHQHRERSIRCKWRCSLQRQGGNQEQGYSAAYGRTCRFQTRVQKR